MKSVTSRIISRGAVALFVLVLVVVAVNVRGANPGITFATNGIDLKIDSKAYYDGAPYAASTWTLKDLVPTADHFFNFGDIKPGDYGSTTVSLHVDRSAFLCLDFSNLQSLDNGVNEPEAIVDPNGTTTGELADGTEFFGWIDNGDGIFQPSEKVLFGTTTQSGSTVLNNTSYIVGDSSQGTACGAGQTCYVGVLWCAGDLVVNTTTGAVSCNGSVLGNAAQSDSFTFDVGVRIESADENPGFLCTGTTTQQTQVPTRTQGFWQTHTVFTSYVFSLPTMQKFIGVNTPPSGSSHKGVITNIQTAGASQLFGAFYSNIAKKTNNAQRSATDKNRMQLLQQLVAAKLNCAMVTCSAGTLSLIASADTAYSLGSANMMTLEGQLDTYNNSGDALALPGSLGSQGSATPGMSQSIANKGFWDLP